LALAVPLLHASRVGPNLHLIGLDVSFNDQVVYVDAARHLLADGELTTGVIYPSMLQQDYSRNYLYMPGHAVLLASSFAVFGDSGWSAMAPSLVAYVACALGLYWTGRRLFGVRSGAGGAAALAFGATPVFAIYAFSAMAELTFLASGVLSFAAFVHLPSRWRHRVVPLLLVAPFLCRETGALWIVPMIVLTLWDRDPERDTRARWGAAFFSLVSSVVLLVAILQLSWISDRPSLWPQNLFVQDLTDKYANAFALAGVETDFNAAFAAIARLSSKNLTALSYLLTATTFEALSLHLCLWVPALAAALGWRRPLLRPLVIAWLVMMGIYFVLITTTYQWGGWVGVRQLLTPTVFGMLLVGASAAGGGPARSARFGWIAGAAIVPLSLFVWFQGADEVVEWDDIEKGTLEMIVVAAPPEVGALVANEIVGPIYLYHFPLRDWSFPPANERTLALLEERHNITAALLGPGEFSELSPESVRATGLEFREPIEGFRDQQGGSSQRGRRFAPLFFFAESGDR
jgi:4-amino-4-deoxy-L-arabinose transferase-like glycosyltransferase